MPKRKDIKSILVIGAGPILIGQAAEFDYSGTQAIKVLKQEGYRVVLVNSNPATIMTDPEYADATYLEPITTDLVEMIIDKERPDALLPTVGGQTALNLAVELTESGVLRRFGVELIGAKLGTIQVAEDRLLFKEAVEKAGLACPSSGLASSVDEAITIANEIGQFPILIRPSFTLGGSGGSIAYDPEELREKVEFGLQESPTSTVLIEESILGWKEFELEVMRDGAGNFVVICGIENLDPMGIHTGDSITIAPTQTLTDREYQCLRDQAKIVIEVVGVETGGSNIQFAINPEDGRILVIEMNPRVSRSSALASKATGFPIAKIAALLAVGYRLDEIRNDITQTTTAAFEPSIDYIVTKLPRWAFEKFPGVEPTLGSQMKSVGEVMAIGRTFKESLMKGLQSLELDRKPFPTPESSSWDGKLESLGIPTNKRFWEVWEALREGRTIEEVATASGFDPWFTAQMAEIVSLEHELVKFNSLEEMPIEKLRAAKRMGFGDEHIAWLLNSTGLLANESLKADPATEAIDVRKWRKSKDILPTYHVIDTCAAEFESFTPYLYSSFETESEGEPTSCEKVIILGSGPNRIGQGIEFDYCCVHAALAIKQEGIEALMINCNPETVSTDYDTSDRLYFEPLTLEHVLNVIEREQPIKGVIVQFGGQTPLKLARGLQSAGIPILGTSSESIDIAEDRGRFCQLMDELGIPVPTHGLAFSIEEAFEVAGQVEYPVIVRPSYVLGGRAMAIVYDERALGHYVQSAFQAVADQPILIDHYLEDAYEVDVDAIADGMSVTICGVMQHIEEAGVHSGDSACVLPPYKVSAYHLSHIHEYTRQIGVELEVCGLMNIQFAIKDDIVYALEVNPRASRTVPYVSKATGIPMAKIATRVIIGQSLQAIELLEEPTIQGFFVKEAVFPFRKFLGVDNRLGPEMRSTGEVMGFANDFGHAFAKAQLAAGNPLPTSGTVFISVNDFDKSSALKIARDLSRLGFSIIATQGTADYCSKVGIEVEAVNKVSEGSPHIVDLISKRKVDLVINTPLGSEAHSDGALIRMAALRYQIPITTTLSAAQAAVKGIQTLKRFELNICSLQEHYRSPPHISG